MDSNELDELKKRIENLKVKNWGKMIDEGRRDEVLLDLIWDVNTCQTDVNHQQNDLINLLVEKLVQTSEQITTLSLRLAALEAKQ